MLKIVLIALLGAALCATEEVLESDPYTLEGNEVKINTYKSKLTKSEREDYLYWIRLRNSFYYSDKDGRLAKMTNYFEPEKEGYYKPVYYFGIPYFFCGILFAFLLLVYLFVRFVLKGCNGPKKGITDSYTCSAWGIALFGTTVAIVMFSLALYHGVKQK